MSVSARRLLVAVAAAAVVVAVVVGAMLLSREDEPPVAAHSASASSGPSAGAASQTETPDDPAEAFAAIEADVLEIRGLEAPDIGPADIIDRDELGRELEELLDEEWTEEELFRSNMTLRAMGLLTADQDLRALNERLLAEQVIGFYDPAEERMVVVSDQGLTSLARLTYAHEYTHALQDAAFGTFEVRDALTDDDAILARQALEEGDATFVMVLWAYQHLAPDEIADVGTQPVPDMSGIPDWMVAQLSFPYDRGFAFVTSLRAGGGWEGIDGAYTDAPASTEQIIHPEKYLAGEEPLRVEPPELADVFGRGWRDLEATTMGEAMIDIWLTELGADDATADAAAAGWGGDRLVVATGLDDAWVMGWRIAWDTEADADEFDAAYGGLEPGGGIASDVLRPSPTETLVVHASSADVLAAVIPRLQR
jgi:hypothetical protein